MNNYNTCIECGQRFSGRKKKYCSKQCSDEVRRRKQRERNRKANPPKPDVLLSCEWCGKGYTVPPRTAHQSRFCSDTCKDTWWSRVELGHRPMDEWVVVRDKNKAIRLKEIEEDRIARTIKKECAWCGDTFSTLNNNIVTCSTRCSKKRASKLKWLRSDSRLNDNNIVDRDITLDKLYNRDDGMCYLCNELCNYNDKEITIEGHFIAGKTYPSIDHVIAIANGGLHSWDNVKLCHHYCNGVKSDRILHKITDEKKTLS